jgi:CRISPR-associated protein Csm4
MKRRLMLLRCRPGVQFHLGETSLEDSSELLHADTLFSAFANTWALAYGSADEWVTWVREGRVRLSSGLHCLEVPGRDEPVFFVPAPPLRWINRDGVPLPPRRLKAVRHVSLGVLAKIRAALRVSANVDALPVCALDLLDNLAFPRLGGGYACTEEEIGVSASELPPNSFLHRVSRPRLQARSTSAFDNYYHAHAVSFSPVPLPGRGEIRGHFYTVLDDSLNADELRRFEGCARLLADEGVGGERSVGYGCFEEVRFLDAPRELDTTGMGVSLSLSPVVPADNDELQRALHYTLFLRGGGSIGVHGDAERHRSRVRMMREGALFRVPVRGRLVDVSPSEGGPGHPVLRNGLCFALPLEAA